MNYLAIYLGAGFSVAAYRALLDCGLNFASNFNPKYFAADIAIWPIVVLANMFFGKCVKCAILQPATALVGAALAVKALGVIS